MNENLNVSAKQIGDALIDMSALLDNKMQKWSDVSKRPNNLSNTECVGFINNESSTPGLNFTIDIQAPADKNEATLRLWALDSKPGEDGVERFNNIQLDFTIDKSQVVSITDKGSAVTREDIRAGLHDQTTQLTRLIVSNQSGFDKASQQSLGERYDLKVSELDQNAGMVDKVISTLHAVLSTLNESTAAESKL